jgi:uncharacterized protein YggE
MWKFSLSALYFLAAPAFGQFESHALSITATRSIYVQPDQAVFGLSVSSSAITTLEQAAAPLSGLGITSANLSGEGSSVVPPSFQWSFTLAAPLSSLTATIGSIVKLQQTIGQNNSGLTLTFSVNGTEVSPQLQQAQSCSNSDLIADATAQAQKLATAAGLALGPIRSLSNAPLAQAYAVPSLVVVTSRLGDFAPGSFSSPLTCSLTVQFQLQP